MPLDALKDEPDAGESAEIKKANDNYHEALELFAAERQKMERLRETLETMAKGLAVRSVLSYEKLAQEALEETKGES